MRRWESRAASREGGGSEISVVEEDAKIQEVEAAGEGGGGRVCDEGSKL